MKRLLITSMLFAAAGLTGAATAAPIAVTGLNADIVAEAGNGAITTVTDAGIVSNIFTLAEAGYTGVAGQTGTPLTITSDTVTTQNGTVFSVDADANNAMIGDGTLTLSTPGQYEALQFLLFFVGGDYEVTLNFSDASQTVMSEDAILDWQGSNSLNAFAFGKSSAPRRDDSTYFATGLHMREVSFALSLADQAKTLNSIDIDYSGANDRSSTVAVSGTPVPEPGSLALLGLGGLLIARRRRS